MKLYEPLQKAKEEKRRIERNKVHRTPSLDYQRSGTRKQDLVEFDPALADCDPCLVCNHFTTISVEPDGNTKANAANEQERRGAMAAGGNGVVNGTSAMCVCVSWPPYRPYWDRGPLYRPL